MSSIADHSPRKNSLAFILHAHQPYVLAHEHWPQGAEALYEAAAQTYVPLLNTFNRLANESCSPQITIGLSPLLCEMLSDLAFADGFEAYLQKQTEIAGVHAHNFARQGEEELRDVAFFWENWYTQTARAFEQKYNRDLVDAFRRLQNEGHLEIIATTATHAALSNLGTTQARQAQLHIGIEAHKKHFGRPPCGLWLSSGDKLAADANNLPAEIEYLVVGSGANLPNLTDDSEFSAPVRSGSDYAYEARSLDFRKRHFPGNVRLWRVTSPEADLSQKQPYDPLNIVEVSPAQSARFIETVKDGLLTADSICTIFDARLFGWQWFEGPNWLYRAIKGIYDDGVVNLTTGQNLAGKISPKSSQNDGKTMTQSTLDQQMGRSIHSCEEKMTQLATEYSDTPNPKLREILEQCGRELLLMQSSGWDLLPAEYSELRCAEHIEAFGKLAAIAQKVGGGEFMTEGERVYLDVIQERDRPFGDVPVEVWAKDSA